MKVTFFQDKIGNFVSRHSKTMIKLGNWETSNIQDKLLQTSIISPIYVTGLARSGTTIILEKLACHPDVVSYRYKDFPLAHIPYWWENFLNRAGSSDNISVERAHKDRIKITPDSPEAMEEIIWMSFYKKIHDPSINNILDEDNANDNFVEFYKDNIKKMLLSRNGKRYLAKGNYNISRIELLNSIFLDAKFVIAVRNPIDTIASLIKQHNLFCVIEKDDNKVLRYMQNLGHFEFGLDRRPINFGKTETTANIQKYLNNDENVKGLAKYWSEVYSYVADLLKNDRINNSISLIDFDEFCKKPFLTLQNLYDFCDLDIKKSIITEQANTISAPKYYEHGFSNNEIEIINKETEEVLSRIRSFIN